MMLGFLALLLYVGLCAGSIRHTPIIRHKVDCYSYRDETAKYRLSDSVHGYPETQIQEELFKRPYMRPVLYDHNSIKIPRVQIDNGRVRNNAGHKLYKRSYGQYSRVFTRNSFQQRPHGFNYRPAQHIVHPQPIRPIYPKPVPVQPYRPKPVHPIHPKPVYVKPVHKIHPKPVHPVHPKPVHPIHPKPVYVKPVHKIHPKPVHPVHPKPVHPIHPKPVYVKPVHKIHPKPVHPIHPKPVHPIHPKPVYVKPVHKIHPKPVHPIHPKPVHPIHPKPVYPIQPKPVPVPVYIKPVQPIPHQPALPIGEACPSTKYTLRRFWYYGNECYVINPAYQKITYAKCGTRDCSSCSNNAGHNKHFYDYKHKCVETYETEFIWAYCHGAKYMQRITRVGIKVPKYCSCKTYQC